MKRAASFAIPGDIDTLTGGYIYEKQLLFGLRRLGWDITHLALPGDFPDPSSKTLSETAALLAALPPDQPVILDGFLPGAMPPDQLAEMQAPFVAVTHHPLAYETGLSQDRANYLFRTERANLARAAHVIVPSAHTASMLVGDFGIGQERIAVAPPGVFRPEASTRTLPEDPEILSVGQLVPRKGHDVLLRALAEITDIAWTARIVGHGADAEHRELLQSLVISLGLDQRVTFAGLLSPDDLTACYARASVFALATRYEGYGMVFAEAMVHGLPIVTCSGGAVADTVPKDAGLIAPVDDVPAIADALRQILTDAPLRSSLASGSARRGSALPQWDDTARIVSEVLARITP